MLSGWTAFNQIPFKERIMEFPIASFRRFSPFALTCVLLVAAIPGFAAECKGSAQDACATNAQCAWVAEYVRSDGRKVNGYCRTRPKSKQDAGAKTQSSLESGKTGQSG
jgi:hypothetical protein